MKNKIEFVCESCGARFPRWAGKCSNCGEWNTLIQTISTTRIKKQVPTTEGFSLQKLDEIQILNFQKIPTQMNEIDRVLGGGFVPSSVVLLSGDPGIGKSTLVLQLLGKLPFESLYLSGEESPEQIKLRGTRLGLQTNKIAVANETNLEIIQDIISNVEIPFIVIDSIQTIFSDEINSPPGSILQVRESTQRLMKISKKLNKILFLIGHVNKDGNIAGPKALEHIVDTVLILEGEKTSNIRILRSIKNRFGSTLEIGLFEMSSAGLVELSDVNKLFLSGSSVNSSGTTFTPIVEGARTIVVETQSLVSFTNYAVPQRNINGYDFKRLQMILAVLDKKLGLNIRQNDIFVNVTGGVYIDDTALDLGIAASLVSSLKDEPVANNIAIFGEIGLTGEVRAVSQFEKRIFEAEKMGFKKIILPSRTQPQLTRKFNLEMVFVEKISEAIINLFG